MTLAGLSSAQPTGDWAQQLTTIRQQIAEQAAALDHSGDFPAGPLAQLQQAGFLSLATPVQYGGAGADLPRLQQAIAAIAWGEPATALIVCMQYIHHLRLAENDGWAEPLRRQVYRDAVEQGGLINSLRVEPELGSPARGGLPQTVAERTADGWRLNGHKLYTTGIEGLSWLAIWARSDDAEPLVGTWLVPKNSDGVTIIKSWDHAGMRATGSHEVVLNDVVIPRDHAVDIWPLSAPRHGCRKRPAVCQSPDRLTGGHL